MRSIRNGLVRCAVALMMAMLILVSRATVAYAMTRAEIQSQIINDLYKGAGGQPICDFDGYTSSSGRHEGIDFASDSGAPIYAVFSGTVTGKGTNGTGVTVLAIYNEEYDVTIVYEHADFCVLTGETIEAGDQLGVEGSNGAEQAHTHFELRTGNRTHGAINSNATLENPDPYPYFAEMLGGSPYVEHVVDSSYPTPITAVPRATSGRIQTYDEGGNAESNRWIDTGDVCTITAVYADGWLQVSYPSISSYSGYRTAYVNKDVFFASNNIIDEAWSPSSIVDSYKYADLTESFGSVWPSDSCVVTGRSGNNYQVIYPIASGYKLAWVSTTAIPAPGPLPEPVYIPCPGVSNVFCDKEIVVMAPERIDFAQNEYISAGDICTIRNVNIDTGYCEVTYPTGGFDDVFTAGQTKVRSVPIATFLEYQPSYAIQQITVDEQFQVFPLSASETYGRSWYIDPGDECYTVAKVNDMTEIFQYCTRGRFEGYWRIGWVDMPYYTIDLNGWLDGVDSDDLGSYGAVDVYVNGNRLVQYARDFDGNHGTFPSGSTYEIKNIQASMGYTYNGVHTGSLSGTLRDDVSISLDFTKDPVSLTGIRVANRPSKLEYSEGEGLDVSGLEIEAVYSDGSTSDVTDDYSVSGYESTPGIKTVEVVYDDKTTAFTVVVRSKSPVGLSLDSDSMKTGYKVNDELSFEGLQVIAVYDNETSEVVDDYEVMIEDGTTSSAGAKTVNVYYAYNSVEVEAGLAITVSDQTPEDPAYNDGWVDLEGGKRGYRKNGELVVGWLPLDGAKYRFYDDGTMVTGWYTIGSSKYYFHEDGRMATGWTDLEVSGKTMHYYFNPASGNLARGTWMDIDGKKYYFRPSGNAAHGWATINDNGVDKKYYFDDDFQMVTGWQDIEVDGKVLHYYFRPSGSMATGWATIDGKHYYFRPSGNMATGFTTVTDDAYKRYFDQDGTMLTGWQRINGNTYYFRPSGAMQTGTKEISGVTYVFNDKGVLVR